MDADEQGLKPLIDEVVAALKRAVARQDLEEQLWILDERVSKLLSTKGAQALKSFLLVELAEFNRRDDLYTQIDDPIQE